jgi:hypothetical protein
MQLLADQVRQRLLGTAACRCPVAGPQKSCVGHPAGGRTTIAFRRPLIACDTKHDLSIQPGVPDMLIWAAGDSPRVSYHFARRGSVSVVLDPLPPCPANAKDLTANCSLFPAGAAATEMPRSPAAKTMDLTFPKITVRIRQPPSVLRHVDRRRAAADWGC